MTMECIPLDVLPGTEGVCSTCVNPEHAPADETDHPFTMRVAPTGYVLCIVPDVCPVCKDPLNVHKHLDLDLGGNVRDCDRANDWAFR